MNSLQTCHSAASRFILVPRTPGLDPSCQRRRKLSDNNPVLALAAVLRPGDPGQDHQLVKYPSKGWPSECARPFHRARPGSRRKDEMEG